ncbi:MAG: DNA repair protein RecO [Candidatus Omnitrophica bacterium]|nr:DNA repair protein RecO [Candidatus Omnitrophota bacterium]
MAIISTEAIVLRSMDHRETSKLCFFFTRKCGKVIGVLKGIRKDPRKFGSSADKCSVNDIVFYQYRNSDIHLVGQCDMREFFPAIREDIKRINAAEYACELLNKVMPLEEPNPGVYSLLSDFLRALDNPGPGARDARHNSDVNDPLGTRNLSPAGISTLVHMFQIKVLALSGFRPHIDSCVRCGKNIMGRTRFSVLKGGLMCGVCGPRDTDSIAVSAGAVATLLYVEQHDWTACLKLGMAPSIRIELKNILNTFLLYHLEKNIRSAKFL